MLVRSFDQIASLISEHLTGDPGKVTRTARFYEDLKADSRLATNNDRVRAREWMMPILRSRLGGHSAAELSAVFEKNGLPFAPITRPQDLFDHPHLLANGSLAPTTLPGGVKTRLPLLPFQMFGWRPPLTRDPPEVGQHNDEVLAEIGYDKAAVAALKAAGTLGPK